MTWNDKIEELEKLVNKMSNKELAAHFGVTIGAIEKVLSKRSIRRSEAFRKRLMSARLRDQFAENNPNWKGGISADNYHYKKLQKERHPERVRARDKVYKALKSGKLSRQICRDCDSEKTVAHHPDYSRPLDVIWLCRKHHRAEHEKNILQK